MRTIIRDNYTPKNGDYHEKILIDEAQGKTWLFDCDGVFTPIPTPVNVVDEYGTSTTDAASQRLVTETANNASEAIQAETEAREAADQSLQEEIEEIWMSSDVVDVVGTFAQLEQYDTQHLKDNDIIKVLNDETHGHQISYYRFSKAANTFTWVGSEGPYYTESQVDNLLDAKADKADTYTKTVTDALLDNKVDKVAGKGLSTNDFTDNDKTKLDGIEAGAQANVQSDWDQTDTAADDYIKNKPAAPTDFVGTDGQTDGAAGLVPAPLATDAGKYLKADGTWETITIPQSGIPTDATFWGASYDSVNNRVDGVIMFDNVGGASVRRYIGEGSLSGELRLNAPSSSLKPFNFTTNGTTRFVIASNGVSFQNYRAHDLADPTDPQDAATKNYTDNLVASYSTMNGAGAPTTSTTGTVGQFYLDTTNDQMYYLSSIDDTVEPVEYNWETVGGGGGIPTTATFWGQSYDATNNKVDGSIVVSRTSGSTSFIKGFDGSRYFNIYGTGADGSGVLWAIGRGAGDSSGTRDIGLTQTGLKIYRPLNMTSYKISSVADPTAAQDAATKNYTDNLVISYAALNGTAAPTTATEGKYVGQLYYDTTNEQLYFLKEIDDTTTPATYTWEAVGGGSSVNVVQTIGTSTTDVMSQKATTEMIWKNAAETTATNKVISIGDGVGSNAYSSVNIIRRGSGNANGYAISGGVAIGNNAASSNPNYMFADTDAVAIGTTAFAAGIGSVALGARAQSNYVDGSNYYAVAIGESSIAKGGNSVALGRGSRSTASNTVSVGSGLAADSSTYQYRRIVNVKNPIAAQDAATKNYVDTAVASAGAATYTTSEFNNLWENA